MKKKLVILLVLSACLFSSLQAEIQKIIIKWNAALCLDTCIPLLESNLRAIKNVTDFTINSHAGTAEIHWRPGYKFSYEPFNLASRSVGIRLSDIRVRVNGTIAHDQENIFLLSLGDNSSFLLVSPLRPQGNRYMIDANIASHPLSPERRAEFLEAERLGKTVVVEGSLFEPQRYTLTLITQSVQIPANKNEQQPAPAVRRLLYTH